ncbi:MAG: YerC/YecD family TrpR-related protein [Patescibacteria group bacterium]
MNWNSRENTRLIQAILALETSNEARRFLRDLMTEKEIEEFAKRLQTAVLLAENVPYSSIEKTTGLSSTTVARVSKWLNGREGGYRTIIDRLHHHASIQAGRGLS